jgi:hypothetical protein
MSQAPEYQAGIIARDGEGADAGLLAGSLAQNARVTIDTISGSTRPDQATDTSIGANVPMSLVENEYH